MKLILMLPLALAILATGAQAEDSNLGVEYAHKVGAKRLSLALTLLEAFDKNLVCDAEAYPTEINREISAARYQATEATMKKFMSRVSKDSLMNKNLAFREATGQISLFNSEITEATLTKALLGVIFHHPGQGAYGSQYNVTLKKSGVAEEQILEILDDAPWSRWKKARSTWKLIRNENAPLVGHYLQLGTQQYELNSDEQGDLRWIPVGLKEGDLEFYRSMLSSSDAYCDA